MGVNDSDWLDELAARHATGEDVVTLYDEYRAHIADEANRARYTPLHRHATRLMAAWEARDWEALKPWLVPDGTHLTADATRLLLGAWDSQDQQSQ